MLDEKLWLTLGNPIHPKAFCGFDVRALYRPLMFPCTKLVKPGLYEHYYVHRGTVLLELEKGLPQTGKHTIA